jgi:hypothetical protein
MKYIIFPLIFALLYLLYFIFLMIKNARIEVAKTPLTEKEILQVVKFWYLNNYSDILQDEDGCDLEEIINQLIENER